MFNRINREIFGTNAPAGKEEILKGLWGQYNDQLQLKKTGRGCNILEPIEMAFLFGIMVGLRMTGVLGVDEDFILEDHVTVGVNPNTVFGKLQRG